MFSQVTVSYLLGWGPRLGRDVEPQDFETVKDRVCLCIVASRACYLTGASRERDLHLRLAL